MKTVYPLFFNLPFSHSDHLMKPLRYLPIKMISDTGIDTIGFLTLSLMSTMHSSIEFSDSFLAHLLDLSIHTYVEVTGANSSDIVLASRIIRKKALVISNTENNPKSLKIA